MRFHSRLFGRLALLLACSWTASTPAWAGAVRVTQSDARGVTLGLEIPSFKLSAKSQSRSALQAGLDGATHEPGRPALPFGAVLLALPPGARPVARLVESGPAESRSVRLEPNGRPVFQGVGDERQPAIEPVAPIADGPWPASPIVVGEPFTLRGQRLVSIQLQPFQYDERSGTLSARHSLTVRVDFVGAAPEQGVAARDRHFDPVLRTLAPNFDPARAWRVRPAALRALPRPGRGAAPARGAEIQEFDESNPEVRLQTDTSGVYGFSYDDLAAKGFPAGIPVAEVSLHRHEFIENANPSYVTIELPIEVDDANGNGVFDTGDRILAFVQSWAERSRASIWQRTWGDGEVVYATYLTDRAPLRMAHRAGFLRDGLPVLPSYPWSQRFQQRISYTRTPPDTFTEQFLMTDVLFPKANGVISLPFETNDLDTSGTVTVTPQWVGSAGTTHTVWAQIQCQRRNQTITTSVVDSVSWFGYPTYSPTAQLHGSAFAEGPANSLNMWGRSTFEIISYAYLQWFQISYWRGYRSLGGRLPCSSGNASGAYEIDAVGFLSNAIRVYDVTDSLQPVRVDVDPSRITFDGVEYTIAFQDSTAGGVARRYEIFDTPSQLAPTAIAAVTRRQLVDQGSPDYLVVAPEMWLDAANTLADLRRGEGHQVLVAPLESIDDEWNGGRRSPFALRRFFKYALERWRSEFVVLLGDASEDPLNRLGDSGLDFVPTYKIPGPVLSGDVPEIVASDTWLVNFGTPSLPDLFIGRIPANSHDDLVAVVNKLAKYEQVTPDQSWRREVFLLADDNFSTGGSFGVGGVGAYCAKSYEMAFLHLSDSVAVITRDESQLPLLDVEVFNSKEYLTSVPFTVGSFGDTCRNSWPMTQDYAHASVTPLILARLNQGRLWWNFQGHANPYILTHENLYSNSSNEDDKDRFTNVDKPFLFTAFSCHPNAFAEARENRDVQGPSLGEDLVMLPNRGSMASWASTGFEILPADENTHLNTRFAKHLFLDPPRDPSENGSRAVLGEVIAATLIDNYGVTAGFEQGVGWTYNLLGDPGSRISIGSAQVTVAVNGLPVTSGEPVRLSTFGDSLKIEADIASNVEITQLTLDYVDASGSRTIPPSDYTVSPAFPDTGAAGQGGRRFHLSYHSTLTAGSYRYVIHTTDRNGVPGTFEVVFTFQTVLRAAGAPLENGDPVRSDAALSLLVLSPTPIVPGTDLLLTLDGAPLAFQSQPADTSTSGRNWVLTWTSPTTYAPGNHTLDVKLQGREVEPHTFQVSNVAQLSDLMAFPNPFDDQLGTRFSFTYTGSQPFDLLVRVFTIAGHLIYEHEERSLQPGYHQIPWNGRDAEGSTVANGIYLYKMLARSGSNTVVAQGRLVKLRKPRHVADIGDTGNP